MSPESKDPLIGMTLGGCRIQALLGRGGMGTVYRALHIALDKPVALKVLAGHLMADAEFVERFQREARAAAKVEHPNVIQVLNVAEEKEQHFIILQFIDGENLEELQERNGKLDLVTATKIAHAAASGLEALHSQSIVHRDIKPANIMIAKDGSVKITDFGLARNLKAVSNFTTVSGAFMGTPGFIAPEQVDGPAVDARADLYSLGVVYYMMLSNELPFNAINALEMATQRVTLDPIPLEQRVPGVDPRAAAIVAKLLKKNPAERYADAGQVKAALQEILGPMMAAKPAPPAAQAELPRLVRPPAPPRRLPPSMKPGLRMDAPPPEEVAPLPPGAPEESPDQSIAMIPGADETMLDMGMGRRPKPGLPNAGIEWSEVPEVEIKGRRRPPPPKAEPAPAPDVVPEISAGPKKRIIEGPPIAPRAIEASAPLPSRGDTPKPRPLRAEDYPSNPNLRKEESSRRIDTTPRPAPLPPAVFKHQPPPKRDRNIGGNLVYWVFVFLACAALFSVGALGSSLGGDGFLASLPQPFIRGEGLMLRLIVVAAAIGLFVGAFLVNRKQLQGASHPGPAVMMPVFAALCFYSAGLLASAEGQGVERVTSAAQHAFQSLAHPSNLALLSLWCLIAGLMFGMAGHEELDHGAGSILVIGAFGSLIAFAAGGDVPSVVARCKDVKILGFLVGGLLGSFLGLFLAFGGRARTARKTVGLLVLLGALALGYVGGLPQATPAAAGAQVRSLFGAIGQHGIALILGAMLLSWAGWILHRMRTMSFGKGR
jgi:serine/threonine-protein kinase